MKKSDVACLVISLVANLSLAYFAPGLKMDTVDTTKIKVGLVNIDNKNNKIVVERRTSSSPVSQRRSRSDAATAAANEAKNAIASPFERKNTVAAFTNNTEFDPSSGIVDNGAKMDIVDDSTTGFAMETTEEVISFDNILAPEGDIANLPDGYRLGTEEEGITVRWDANNVDPVYPESAQLRGMHGTVTIKMTIDEIGNVTYFNIEKGSAVPEIDKAIEEVGRKWRIYLSRNGLNVKGNVILEYNFMLRGNS